MPDTANVVICGPDSIGVGRKTAANNDAELIVDQDCPPLSIYSMSREDYERNYGARSA